MHVLYVIDSLSPAGAESSLAAIAPRLITHGVRLDVAYLHDRPGLQEQLSVAGARLFRLAGPGRRLGWTRRIRRLMTERRPTLMHTTLFESDVAGRIASLGTHVPVVSSLVNLAYGPEQAAASNLVVWKLRAAQVLDAATARVVVRFHAVSHEVADVMSRRLLIPRGRIDVIPRGRDADELGTRTADRRRRARAGLGAADGEPLVIAVARHEYQKGLDVLLEAFRDVALRVPGARLAIAGREGDQTAALRALSDRFAIGGRTLFLGARTDIAELLCAADAFVFPSRWEGLPGAVLEAMALEAPIVASDIQPVRELVGDPDLGRALLVSPERPDELARAIVEALLDADEAAARARAARERFLERFTLDRAAEGMLAFYERAAAR